MRIVIIRANMTEHKRGPPSHRAPSWLNLVLVVLDKYFLSFFNHNSNIKIHNFPFCSLPSAEHAIFTFDIYQSCRKVIFRDIFSKVTVLWPRGFIFFKSWKICILMTLVVCERKHNKIQFWYLISFFLLSVFSTMMCKAGTCCGPWNTHKSCFRKGKAIKRVLQFSFWQLK